MRNRNVSSYLFDAGRVRRMPSPRVSMVARQAPPHHGSSGAIAFPRDEPSANLKVKAA
jgi:hypothetical protein